MGSGGPSPGAPGQAPALDDAVLGQFVQLQVVEGLPWADDCNVCRRRDSGTRRSRSPGPPSPQGPVVPPHVVSAEVLRAKPSPWGNASPRVSSGDGGCSLPGGERRQRELPVALCLSGPSESTVTHRMGQRMKGRLGQAPR